LFQGPFCPNKYKQQNQNDNNVTPHLCVWNSAARKCDSYERYTV
jgi:hypothetical protein